MAFTFKERVERFSTDATPQSWDDLVEYFHSNEVNPTDELLSRLLDDIEYLLLFHDGPTENPIQSIEGLWQLQHAVKRTGDSAFDIVQGYHFHDAYDTEFDFIQAIESSTDEEPVYFWENRAELSLLFLEIRDGQFCEQNLLNQFPYSTAAQVRQSKAPYNLEKVSNPEQQEKLNVSEYSGFSYNDVPSGSKPNWRQAANYLDEKNGNHFLIRGGNWDSLELFDYCQRENNELFRKIVHIWDGNYVSIFEHSYRLIF